MSKLRTIRLYGTLGAKYGREHQLYVDNTSEAIRALCTQHEGFFEDLRDSEEKGIGFAVFLDKRNIKEEQLDDPVGDADIRIAPIILGSKRGGLFGIILGAVLIATSFIIPGAGAFTVFGFAANGTMFMMGASLLLGGIAQMLAPQPKLELDEQAVSPNKSFNGPVNTTINGGVVPIAIGKVMTGSAVISASIRSEQISNVASDLERSRVFAKVVGRRDTVNSD